MPKLPVPDSVLPVTVAASKGGVYSIIPVPAPIWIVLFVTLAKASATYTPVAEPVAVIVLPEATAPWPVNNRAIISISDALNRIIGDSDVASVGVVVEGGVNVGDDDAPPGAASLIAHRMHIVAVEQDVHSAQGYADPGSIRV